MQTFYKLADMDRTVITPEHSTAEDPTIKGRKVEVGYYCYPPQAGATPHSHPEEQIITVIKGRMRSKVADGESEILGPGEAVYIPARVEHTNWSVDEEVEFFSCKDMVN